MQRKLLLRYARLRRRLLHEFLIPGVDSGCALPAAFRREVGDVSLIAWADATLFLGWRIGALACEYRLLANESLPGLAAALASEAALASDPGGEPARAAPGNADSAAQELEQALFALDRLQRAAPAAFQNVCPGRRIRDARAAGFFLRDDVAPELLQRFHARGAGARYILSDFMAREAPHPLPAPENVVFNKEASQDQICHLLLGLAFAARLGPPELADRARDLAESLVAWPAATEWRLRNPYCNRPVARGAEMLAFASGVLDALAFIEAQTPADFTGAAEMDRREGRASELRRELRDASRVAWASLAHPHNPAYRNSDNLHMVLALACLGGGWNGPGSLDRLAKREGFWFYPLVARLLHGGRGWQKRNGALLGRALAMLASAPDDGPANEAWLHPGWRSSHRFVRPVELQQNGALRDAGKRYNGLDFLFLFGVTALALTEERG